MNEKTSWKLSKPSSIIIIGCVVLIALAWLWYVRAYQNPQATFWGMFNNSLSTTGVTRHITETVGSQSLSDYVQLELGGHNIAESLSTLYEADSKVTTETIGTPTTDYTRYVNILTASKTSNGKPLNFNGIIGVWGKSQPSKNATTDPLDHLFGQTLLGIVPVANLPGKERAQLLNTIKTGNIFKPSFKNVKHSEINGRAVYVYNVKVEPVAYATMLQDFANDEGLGTIPELNPGNYESSAPLNLQFAINPASRELVEIKYINTNHTEVYSGYGIQPAIALPTKTVTTQQLELRLSEIE